MNHHPGLNEPLGQLTKLLFNRIFQRNTTWSSVCRSSSKDEQHFTGDCLRLLCGGIARNKFRNKVWTKNRCNCVTENKEHYEMIVNCAGTNLDVSNICKLCYLMPNATKLDLSFNNAKSLPNFCFKKCDSLRVLNLAYNHMSDMSADSLSGLSNLEVLNLNGNNFLHNHSLTNALKYLSRLTTLHLQDITKGGVENVLVNVSANYVPNLHEIYIDGIENILFRPNFLGLKYLWKIDFTGNKTVCNISALTNKTFQHVPYVSHLNLALCNISVIEAGAFEKLHNLTYLNLSSNNRLGFDPLRNVTYGLQWSRIKSLDYSNVFYTFGVNTELRRCDVWFLKNTSLKELYLNSNRIGRCEVNMLLLFPTSLQILSLDKNSFDLGPYIMQLSCLHNLIRLDVNFAFKPPNIPSHHIKYKEDEITCRKHDECQIPKPKVVNPECPYMDGGDFDIRHVRIPKNLKDISISFSGIRTSIGDPTLPMILLRNGIESIDASYNVIYSWKRPNLKLDNLLKLNLSYNFANFISTNFFQAAPNLRNLDASNNNLGLCLSRDEDGLIFENVPRLRHLNLSSNYMSTLPGRLFSGLLELTSLNLAFNSISNLNLSLNYLTHLTSLDLHQNKLSTLPVEYLEQMNKLGRNISIDLTNNSLAISCGNLKMLEWILSHPHGFKNVDSYMYTENGQIHFLNLKELADAVSHLQKACNRRDFSALISVTSCLILVFIIVILVGLAYRFRWRLRYLYYMSKVRYKNHGRIDNHYQYDAFISYDHEDYLFIKDELIVELEDNSGLSLCVHQRDFLAGNYIAENILQAIKSSRMTVIILTDRFLKSKWCMYEFNMARMESIYSREGENVILCILLGPIDKTLLSPELVECLEHETFLEYPRTESEKAYFWTMLKLALCNN